MKKVWVLFAALFLAVSVSQASIFSCWLTLDNSDPVAVGSEYNVNIWGRNFIDPGVPGESITNSGFSDFGFTVYTPGTLKGQIITEPDVVDGPIGGWGSAFTNWGTKIGPSIQQYQAPTGFGAHDNEADTNVYATDNDAVEAAMGDTAGKKLTIGTTAAVLIATEIWDMEKAGTATLAVDIVYGARHYNPDGSKDYFTTYQQSGVSVTGVGGGAVPVITLTPASQLVNTTARGGTTASVSLTVSQTGGDAATGGTLTYGDSGTAPFSSLPFTGTHTYSIGTYTASATATNGTGPSNTPTASVQVVAAPSIVVLVNGVPATDGQIYSTSAFWGHNNVSLSLVNSTGYVETWSMLNVTNNSLLNVTGTGTGGVINGGTWTGDSYSLYGANGISFTIGNSGTGLNSQSVTLHFTPEPATLALLAFGAVGVLMRRRKA